MKYRLFYRSFLAAFLSRLSRALRSGFVSSNMDPGVDSRACLLNLFLPVDNSGPEDVCSWSSEAASPEDELPSRTCKPGSSSADGFVLVEMRSVASREMPLFANLVCIPMLLESPTVFAELASLSCVLRFVSAVLRARSRSCAALLARS